MRGGLTGREAEGTNTGSENFNFQKLLRKCHFKAIVAILSNFGDFLKKNTNFSTRNFQFLAFLSKIVHVVGSWAGRGYSHTPEE